MKKIGKIIGIILLFVLTMGSIIFFFFPQVLIDVTNNQFASAAHLQEKTIEIDGYEVHYFDNGYDESKETIVLVHGMGDDKNSFLQASKNLSAQYNLVLPDLLGHGENDHDVNKDYSIDGQSNFLKAFITKLGVTNVHLVGNSMGGHTVGAYAIKYPKALKTLTLLNAAGLKLNDHVVYTGFGKEIKTEEEFNAVLDRVFYTRPEMPGPIRKHVMNQINESKDWVDNTLVKAIKNGAYFNLKDDLHKIEVPTLVLWGREDKVVPFASAEYFNSNISNSKLQILEKAGHSPQLEIPDEVAKGIDAFIKNSK